MGAGQFASGLTGVVFTVTASVVLLVERLFALDADTQADVGFAFEPWVQNFKFGPLKCLWFDHPEIIKGLKFYRGIITDGGENGTNGAIRSVAKGVHDSRGVWWDQFAE